jgi:hypothetical protein
VKSPPPPPAQDLHLHPSTEQPELLPNTDRETHKPLPSAQHPFFEAAKDSSSSGFFVSRQKVQNIDKNACRQMFKALEPFRKEVVVDEPSKDNVTTVLKKFSCHIKYQHQEEFWEDGDRDYREFEYGKPLVTKHGRVLYPG